MISLENGKKKVAVYVGLSGHQVGKIHDAPLFTKVIGILPPSTFLHAKQVFFSLPTTPTEQPLPHPYKLLHHTNLHYTTYTKALYAKMWHRLLTMKDHRNLNKNHHSSSTSFHHFVTQTQAAKQLNSSTFITTRICYIWLMFLSHYIFFYLIFGYLFSHFDIVVLCWLFYFGLCWLFCNIVVTVVTEH